MRTTAIVAAFVAVHPRRRGRRHRGARRNRRSAARARRRCVAQHRRGRIQPAAQGLCGGDHRPGSGARDRRRTASRDRGHLHRMVGGGRPEDRRRLDRGARRGGCRQRRHEDARRAALVPRPHLDQRGHRFRDGALCRRAGRREKRIIDISGDGTNNAGRAITEARDQAVAAGVTINGLAIINTQANPGYAFHTQPPGGLPKYYEENVIGGPGAFLFQVENFDDLRRRDHPQAGDRDRRGFGAAARRPRCTSAP